MMTDNKKTFNLDEFLGTYEQSAFSVDQWTRLRQCKTADECVNLITNVRESDRKNKTDNEIIVPVLEFMKLGYLGLLSSNDGPFEMACFGAVVKYENSRREFERSNYISKRVRNAGKHNLWKSLLENIVSKPADVQSDGFKALLQGNRLDASFETFVLKHAEHFSDRAVALSWKRLRDSGYASIGHRVDAMN